MVLYVLTRERNDFVGVYTTHEEAWGARRGAWKYEVQEIEVPGICSEDRITALESKIDTKLRDLRVALQTPGGLR